MILEVFNIQWDILPDEKGVVKLPDQFSLEIPDEVWDDIESDPDDYIANKIADQYGYCVLGFNYV
jgi:hypothetical protein